MRKKILAGVAILFAINLNAQFVDNMESYTDGSTIFTGHWTDFNGSGTKALYSSSAKSVSGSLSGYVPPNGTTDAILDLGTKSSGDWGVKFMMYIPSGREGYFNIQGTVPTGSPVYAVGDIFFNKDNNHPGQGYVSYKTTASSEWSNFTFPHDQWFEVIINIDFGYTNRWQFIVDGNVAADWHTYSRYVGPGQIEETLSFGGIDFYSYSTNCEYWVDDFNYINGHFTPTSCTQTSSSISASACESYTSPSGKVFTSTNVYSDTILNTAGCDSIITIDLTINSNNNVTDVINACGSYTWTDGNTYSSDNFTATQALTNVNGCDSIVTLNLTINPLDITTTSSGNTISAVQSGASYQWIDCNNNNAIIPGETGQSFTPSSNGKYAVIISQGSCTDTSTCTEISTLGTEEYNLLDQALPYPNPNNGLVNFNLEALKDVSIKVYQMNGKLIYQESGINNPKYQINLNGAKGVYYVTLTTESISKNFKFIIQ